MITEYLIEILIKILSSIDMECIVVTIGSSSGSRTKTVSLSAQYKCPSVVDKTNWANPIQYFNDRFAITQTGDTVTAKRLDAPQGWGMRLMITCCMSK